MPDTPDEQNAPAAATPHGNAPESATARVARTRRIYFFAFHFSLFTFIRTFATQKYIIQNSKNV